ncbi:MAG TPA: DoxX family protein [Variovorax sp.]|jgi:putative oxidoreductase|uniref:DoxX family protein n=1 Tax=unclassified Variovorax TaxID=663243 RepID=UPI000F7EF1E0|nr:MULTISPECIES: DoxX family protein [unclassified Variovorax]RSZ30405.1 DoxX family protein [Variovorax sp. 553]RSZ30942.1 DoxX family protein [Variovorax sp. 679]
MVKSDDTGKFILRVSLGVLILLHGIAKLQGGVGFISGMLAQHGLPGALAYLVYIGEVVAPVLLIIGLYTRPAAWIVAINMLVAFALVHMKDLTSLGKQGGWALELQGMFLFAALALAFMGGGRFALSTKYN